MRGINVTYFLFIFILYICVWVYWGDGKKTMYVHHIIVRCSSSDMACFDSSRDLSCYITANRALKSVVLPTSLVAISDSAFYNCLALLTAIIPT